MRERTIRLATGPVTWGVDFADAPTNPAWDAVLDEIAASPLDALELGPVGYLPEDPEVLAHALSSRGLSAVGSFVFEPLHNPARQRECVAVAERVCAAVSAAGGHVVVIIDQPGPERAATAGRSESARRLSGAEWRRMLDLIGQIEDTVRMHGLRPTFHPHAGGFVEFEDEVDRLLSDTTIELCLDTGHAAYAGMVPTSALDRYRDRVGHIHFKDVRGEILRRVQREGLGFWDAIEAGIFCPLGEGVVDTVSVSDTLSGLGYSGFATIEQDRVPGTGDPRSDLLRSIAVLEKSDAVRVGRS